jgi:hypothetical protein
MVREKDESEAISKFSRRYWYFCDEIVEFHFVRPEFGFISLKG